MPNDGPSYETLTSGLGLASFGHLDQVFQDLPPFSTITSEQPERASPEPGLIAPLPLAFEPLAEPPAGLAAAAEGQKSESSPSRSSASAEPDEAAFGDVSYMAGQSLAASAGLPGRSEQRAQSTLQLCGLSAEQTALEIAYDAAASQQPPPSQGTTPAGAAQSRSEAPAEPSVCFVAAFPLDSDQAQAEPMAAVATGQQRGLESMASAPPGPSRSEAADQASPSALAAVSLEHEVAEAEPMAEHEGIQGTGHALAGYAGLSLNPSLPAAGMDPLPATEILSASAAPEPPQQATASAVQLHESNMLPEAAVPGPGPDNAERSESSTAQQRSNVLGEQPASQTATLLGLSKAQAKRARQAAARARAAQGAQQSGHKRGWQEWLGKEPGELQWAV